MKGVGQGTGSGDYDKFVKDYAGDYYKQYMGSAAADKLGDASAATGAAASDYEQLAKIYSGDFAQYMSKYGKNYNMDVADAKSADYQKFMNGFADYMKFSGHPHRLRRGGHAHGAGHRGGHRHGPGPGR